MAGNVRGTGSGLFPAWGRVFRFKEELASRQGRGTGPRVPGRELPGFCGSENPYGKQLRGSPPRRGRPQKGADTAGSRRNGSASFRNRFPPVTILWKSCTGRGSPRNSGIYAERSGRRICPLHEKRRRRRAFRMTDTELRHMAPAAMTGESRMPQKG